MKSTKTTTAIRLKYMYLSRIALKILLSITMIVNFGFAHAQTQDAPTKGGGFNIDLGSVFRLLTAHKRPVDDNRDVEIGQVQVLWESPSLATAGVAEIAQTHGFSPTAVENLTHLGVVIALYQVPDHQVAREFRDGLRHTHPDWTVDFNAIQTPNGDRLYALEQMNVPSYVSDFETNALKHTRIGVIDGPYNTDVILQTSEQVYFDALPKEDQASSARHGNSVAALIAGAPLTNGFIGAAPNVGLYWAAATRQINGRDSTNSFLMSKALDWLVGRRVQVVNVSMGGSGDTILSTVFRRAGEKPLVMVASAGNGGAMAAPVYPAAYSSVLAVTAVDAAGQIYSRANSGAYIAIAAPGVDVWTPTSGYVSGTSFASALTAGVIARLGGAFSKRTVLNRLCANAKDLGEQGNDDVYGCGLLQLR